MLQEKTLMTSLLTDTRYGLLLLQKYIPWAFLYLYFNPRAQFLPRS